MKFFSKKINKDSETLNRESMHTRGFTIVETLVAIFVLLISTTGPLAFAQNGLRASFLARDQITAFYLAQDTIETIKNIRDTNTLKYRSGQTTVSWLDNMGDCKPSVVGETVVCNFDTINNATESCSVEYGCTTAMHYNETSKEFSINPTDSVSKYTRTIYVTQLREDEIQVVVEVGWDSNFLSTKRIVVQENIFKKY